MRVLFYTLGCKLNQAENESIACAFKAEGFDVDRLSNIEKSNKGNSNIDTARTNPCLYIINTCTVTSKAEQKARRVIRKLINDDSECCLLVTGCYAQLNEKEISALDDESNGSGRRLFVIRGDEKSALLDFPRRLKELTDKQNVEPPLNDIVYQLISGSVKKKDDAPEKFKFNTAGSGFRSRAFLKIQDGCDNACTFCRVTLARGKNVCLDAPAVLEKLLSLENGGFCEAVLSGVNICQYTDKQSGIADFPALLQFLLDNTNSIALRLSSLEYDCFNDDFFNVIKNKRIRPHFHLSIQSGSGKILKRMGRNYSDKNILDALHCLRQSKDDPFAACDIITGFPGEDEKDFEKTFALCEEADFAWIHSFPYSRRQGTAAWDFKERVSERLAKERVEKLLELGKSGKERYTRRWINKDVDAIRLNEAKNGGFTALSDNYLRLFVEGGNSILPEIQKEFRCRIKAPMICGENADVLAVLLN